MISPSLAAELYQYTTLGSDSAFRLLKLLKGSGPELECELSPRSLEDGHPSYEALSYTWGSSELVECITLDRKLLWVTDNLHSALQSLRLCDRDRILWIDAICINQGDKVEQSQQVQQMGQIFEQAEKVLFWLGKATAQIIALMETLNQCQIIDSVCYYKQQVLKDWPCEDHSIGLRQLLNREWFTRVWILQEAAKAHKADVCCGIRSIPAEIFVLAPSLMKQEPPPHCKPVLDIMAESFRATSWWAQTRDLRTLLCRFQASKATDERDKIYALLGMSSDPLDIKALTVDYQRPTSQVIREAITHLLQPTQSIQSNPFAVHEVLNLMSFFSTLDVTYFVPVREVTAETIYPHLQSGYRKSDLYRPEVKSPAIAVVNDPTLFLFEERPAQNLRIQKTCYSQIVELMLDEQSKRALQDEGHDNGMHIFSWGSVEHHIKVVVIHDKTHAIVKAAMTGCIQVARRLLHMKLGTEGEEECEALVLSELALQGRTEVLQSMLIDAHANVNAHGGEYGTVLQAAAYNGRAEVATVTMLLEAGADVNAQSGRFGNALQAAARRGSTELITILLKAGADVNAPGGEYGNALQAAAFQLAVYDSGVEVVTMLLKAGADVNAQGGRYGNALQAAAYEDNAELVELLLKAGADVNAQGGEYGNALQAAAYGGKEELVELLLKAGADVNACGGRFGNALQAAARRGSTELVEILLKAGADVNAQGGEYGSALQAAELQRGVRVVELLLKAGADVNAQGGRYGNALQAAAWEGSVKLVKILLKAGANVKAQGGGEHDLVLPLRKNKEVMKMLLEGGADISDSDMEYWNAFDDSD